MSQTVARTETEALLTFLNNQREHVLGILDGVDEETLRRPILPSGWSCLGLVQHLALDVERFWFGAVIAGDQAVIKSLADVGNAWTVDPAIQRRQSLSDTAAKAIAPMSFCNRHRSRPLRAGGRQMPLGIGDCTRFAKSRSTS